MRKALLIIAVLFCACTVSCTSNPITYDEEFLMPLKIGVLEYDPESKNSHLTYLSLGQHVTTAFGCPYGDMDTVNINILFEYEGGNCVITSEDEDIQLSMGPGGIMIYHEHFYKWEERSYSFQEEINNTGWLAINPIGSSLGHTYLYNQEVVNTNTVLEDIPPGREYFLTVSASDFRDGKHVADVKLKIVQLPTTEDDPLWTITDKSRFFTIELVEYELSDTYKMMME